MLQFENPWLKPLLSGFSETQLKAFTIDTFLHSIPELLMGYQEAEGKVGWLTFRKSRERISKRKWNSQKEKINKN